MIVATLTGSPCHLGVHDAGWAAPGQSLAGTVVDALFDRSQIGEREGAQSLPLGKYWRRSPLVFSFVPRSHGLAGGAKKMPSAKYSSSRWWQAISEPWSQVTVCRARSGRPVNTGSIA